MMETWIPLASIPADGASYTIDSPEFWNACFAEFNLPCKVLSPITATITVLPQEEGVLLMGSLAGKVTLPCNRCTEASEYTIATTFETFEGFPPDTFFLPAKGEEEEVQDPFDETLIRQAAHGRGIEVNPSALAWQEFSLALPVKPLCSEGCHGLCPTCGCNKNHEACNCVGPDGDPRLAALRGLVIKK